MTVDTMSADGGVPPGPGADHEPAGRSQPPSGRDAAIKAVLARMAELELSALALAGTAGVNRESVAMFLDGRRWPQFVTRAKIEKALGWPTGRIEEVATQPAGRPFVVRSEENERTDSVITADLVTFLDNTERGLTPPQRNLIEQEIRAFALRRALEIRGEI